MPQPLSPYLQKNFDYGFHLVRLAEFHKYQVFMQASNELCDASFKSTRALDFLEFYDSHVQPYLHAHPHLDRFSLERHHKEVNDLKHLSFKGMIRQWNEKGPFSHFSEEKSSKLSMQACFDKDMWPENRSIILGKRKGFQEAKQLILNHPFLPALQKRHPDLLFQPAKSILSF